MGGEYVESEEAVVGGSQPIWQRRLFQVANAIHFQRDPVAGARHRLRGGRMVGIGVIQQRGRKERRYMDGGENQQQQRPGTHWGEDWSILGRRLKGEGEVIRHGSEKRGH